jgi:hypothetical protein
LCPVTRLAILYPCSMIGSFGLVSRHSKSINATRATMAGLLRGSCWRGANLAYSRECGIMLDRSWSLISVRQFASFRRTPPPRTGTLVRRGFSSSNKPTDGASASKEKPASWWENFIAAKTMPTRYTAAWYREMLLVCTVFAITGSTTMVVCSPPYVPPL